MSHPTGDSSPLEAANNTEFIKIDGKTYCHKMTSVYTIGSGPCNIMSQNSLVFLGDPYGPRRTRSDITPDRNGLNNDIVKACECLKYWWDNSLVLYNKLTDNELWQEVEAEVE
jgi:hypothetical protein